MSRARPVGGLRFATRLISATAAGVAGNGSSRRPDANDRADVIAFDTAASDLFANDFNKVRDVVRALLTPKGQTVEQVSVRYGTSDGDSIAPAITRPGSPIFFETDATNLGGLGFGQNDNNLIRDIYFWNVVSRKASLQSRGSDQRILGVDPTMPPGLTPFVKAEPNTNAATSYYGNYIAFETSNPLVDLTVARKYLPAYVASPARAAIDSRLRPELHQIYLRYIGPA